ncbi:MAG TPA: VOC family protein [Vicinamibacterales bacterium]|jgi:catechol 2,3-dioxygenase-like lactoylglutathione lyase family enzyme|nr:VOC family protein [Vicinamibacterales bacterium]
MEHIISNLLTDFEHGKMTRRQLIQSLALTATAASAVGAAPVAAAVADGQGFKALAVNHISYQVADYKKTRDFYADLLGMKVSHDDGKQAYLSFGNHGTWLLPRNAREPGTAPKVDHIAYTIDHWDKDKVKAELERRGLDARPDTDNSFHVKDPDGFDLQISGKGMKP